MATNLLERPSSEDEDVEPLFDSNTPQSLYDDEFEKIVSRSRNQPDEDDEKAPKEESPEALREAEEAGASEPDNPLNFKDTDEGDSGGGIIDRGRNRINKAKAKIGNSSRGKKIVFGLGVGGGAGILVFGVLLLALMSQLKIVHLAENVTVYNMARSARQMRLSESQLTAEAIDAEGATVSNSRINALKARFEESRIKSAIDEINTYRPGKLLAKMNSELTPIFTDGPPSKFLGRPTKILEGWGYKGEVLEKTDRSLGSRFFRDIPGTNAYNDKLRLGAEFNSILENDLGASSSYVRGKVVNQELIARGAGKLRWWQKRGSTYKDLSAERAEYTNAKQLYEESKTTRSSCAVEQICKAEKAANDAGDEALKAAEGKSAVQTEEEVSKAMSVKIAQTVESPLAAVLDKTSAVYSVALPLCLVYDGSVNNGSNDINNAEDANVKAFMMTRTAADQIKAGATTPEAISGLSGQLGNIEQSVPMRRAGGEAIDSTKETASLAQPQSTGNGTFSLVNVLFDKFLPSSLINFANTVMGGSCPVVTSLWTGGALAIAEGLLTVLTGGASAAGEDGLARGIARYVTESFGKFIEENSLNKGAKLAAGSLGEKVLSKQGGKFLLKTGAQVGATIGATELAKLLVARHSNGANNGLATNATLANQVDMGSNIYAQDTNRKLLYGRPLTSAEVSESNVADVSYRNGKDEEKPFSERYFALENPTSLISSFGASLASVFQGPNAKLSGAVHNLASSIASTPKILAATLSPKVLAEAPVSGAGDYNIVQWGFSNAEENLIDTNPDYSPLENALVLDQSGLADKIEATYKSCYADSDGDLFSSGKIQREVTGEVKASSDDGLCSPANLGIRNNIFGDLVFRWRLNHRNDNIREHLVDLQEAPDAPAASVAPTPSTATSPTTNSTPSDSGDACAAGTDSLGTADGYSNGAKSTITLCAVNDLKFQPIDSDGDESVPGKGYYINNANNRAIVNSSISAKVVAMAQKAKTDGTPLTAISSFRSNDHQIKACGKVTNNKCANGGYALPGYSSHQSGEAIDFLDSNRNSTANCKKHMQGSRCVGTDAVWTWLSKNAESFGLKQLPAESWHWSVSGT